jgi:hypothetical protein
MKERTKKEINRFVLRKVSRQYASKHSTASSGIGAHDSESVISRNTRVCVCVCKQLLHSELLIHTTCIKLSHIQERMRCRTGQHNIV